MATMILQMSLGRRRSSVRVRHHSGITGMQAGTPNIGQLDLRSGERHDDSSGIQGFKGELIRCMKVSDCAVACRVGCTIVMDG